MISFSTTGNNTINLTIDKQDFLVFPDKDGAVDGKRVLLDHPEEEPSEGVISWPGEYDIGGVAILGIGHDEGAHVSFALEWNSIRLGFLCSPLHNMTDHELELLGDIDVLFIPSDDPKIVQKLIDEIDPRVLCPLPTGGADKYTEVLKIAGAQNIEAVDEYKLKGALPAEGREVVILSA